MPSHSHSITASYGGSGGEFLKYENKGSQYSSNGFWTSSLGEGQPHNNLQPYVVVYRWRRIA